MGVPELILEALRVLNIDQAGLAKRLKRGQPTVSRWLSGDANPDYESCLRLAQITGMSAATVLETVGLDPLLIPADPGVSRTVVAHATRSFARWLKLQGIPVADLEVVKIPRVPERVQPRLRPGEFAALESVILRRLVERSGRVPRVTVARGLALIYFLADTGLRASEVCALHLKSIDFERGCVLVKGKGNKERVLSLVDPNDPQGGTTLRLLRDWIVARATVRGNAHNQQLWTSVRGRPLSTQELRRVLAELCEAAGIDSNRPPHTFRRAAFTEGYLADPTAVRVLAARMGWSSKSHQMLDVYTRGANMDTIATTPVTSVSGRLRLVGASRAASLAVRGKP